MVCYTLKKRCNAIFVVCHLLYAEEEMQCNVCVSGNVCMVYYMCGLLPFNDGGDIEHHLFCVGILHGLAVEAAPDT